MWDLMLEGIALAVVGMVVVFCALCLTAVAMALLSRCMGEEDTPQSAPPARPTPGQAPSQSTLDAHLKVIVAAASAVAIQRGGSAVRVTSVRPVKGTG